MQTKDKTMTKANEERLRRFERKVLRRIFGPKYDPVEDQYKIRTNRKLKELYVDPDLVQEIKAQRLRWAGHIQRQPESRLNRLVWKRIPGGKRPVGRPRTRWRDNIRSDLDTMGI